MASLTFKLTADPHCSASPKEHGDLAITGDVTGSIRIGRSEYIAAREQVDGMDTKTRTLLFIALAAWANGATNAQTLNALLTAQGYSVTV